LACRKVPTFPPVRGIRDSAMHVLFVDDDQTLTQSVAMAFRRRGHTCQIAELGEQAVKLAKDDA